MHNAAQRRTTNPPKKPNEPKKWGYRPRAQIGLSGQGTPNPTAEQKSGYIPGYRALHPEPAATVLQTAQSTVTKATKCNTMQPKTAFSTPSHPVACARRDGFSAAVIMADTGQELGSARAARRRVTLANSPENRASTMVEYLPSICAGADETGKTTSNGSCTRIWTWRRRSAARGPMRRGGHSAT